MSVQNGRLGVTMTSAGTWIQAAQIPLDVSVSNVSVSLCNQGSTNVGVDVAFSLTTTPSNAEKLESGVVIGANGGVYKLSCELASPGEYIMVKASTPNVSVRVTAIHQL